ncbi:MAG: DUF5063 domain-containing protein [Bacteroidales bacterium]|nr:DUF5063 domain-containing protein [Candidatus Physcousia equi]
MESVSDKPIYQHNTIEFTQVAVQFCALLEQGREQAKKEIVETLLKLLPLLYLKAQMLPKVESNGAFMPKDAVTEADYDYVRYALADMLGEDDEYLDVCYEKLMATDDTEWKRVSEQLADIYQPIRNFLATYQGGLEDCMTDALWCVRDSFELYWGEALVDSLRRLHRIHYSIDEDYAENS